MAQCRVCMAAVTWAQPEEGGEKIPLDDREVQYSGEGRWRIKTFNGETPIIQAVAAEWPGDGMVDHRTICQRPRVI